eukprot:PhF_6_TR12916/c0_g1_i1/m.20360
MLMSQGNSDPSGTSKRPDLDEVVTTTTTLRGKTIDREHTTDGSQSTFNNKPSQATTNDNIVEAEHFKQNQDTRNLAHNSDSPEGSKVAENNVADCEEHNAVSRNKTPSSGAVDVAVPSVLPTPQLSPIPLPSSQHTPTKVPLLKLSDYLTPNPSRPSASTTRNTSSTRINPTPAVVPHTIKPFKTSLPVFSVKAPSRNIKAAKERSNSVGKKVGGPSANVARENKKPVGASPAESVLSSARRSLNTSREDHNPSPPLSARSRSVSTDPKIIHLGTPRKGPPDSTVVPRVCADATDLDLMFSPTVKNGVIQVTFSSQSLPLNGKREKLPPQLPQKQPFVVSITNKKVPLTTPRPSTDTPRKKISASEQRK